MKNSSICHLKYSIGYALLGTIFNLLALSVPAQASTTVCVTNADDLQAALTAALGSASTTQIEVARGTYNLSAQLDMNTTTAGQGQLDISGGYSSDCSTHIDNPALTVLDSSTNTDPNGGVLNLESTGGLSVRYLTIQGSKRNYGLFMSVTGGAGGIIMDYNIIRNGTGSGAIGPQILGTATGNIHVDGNLITGNAGCCGATASGFIVNQGSGQTYVSNNTVTGNTNMPSTESGGITIQTATTANFSNNIFWNNTNTDIYLRSQAIFVDNDYVAIFGPPPSAGSIGNVDVDPQFASASDYHLSATSPLLGQGTLTPAGNLPTIDIEGYPRSYNSFVDMGAYERGDEIYRNDFDN